MQTEPAVRGVSPWGNIDNVRKIAPGLVVVSTSSHGGTWMSPDRRREFFSALPGVKVWNNQLPWLEEDSDWALAVLVWPALFEADSRRRALQSVRWREGDKAAIDAFLATKRGRAFVQEVVDYETSLAGKWEVESVMGRYPDKPWVSVHLKQVGTQKCRVMGFKEWPEQQFYTEEELLAAAYQPVYDQPVNV